MRVSVAALDENLSENDAIEVAGRAARRGLPVIAPVSPGDVLASKYRVDHVIGMGGMGVVVAAHHLQLDTPVAIKFLLSSSLENREAVVRFEREARAAVKLKSEYVARVIDVGTLENGAPYMVMEYLNGCDLATWRERQQGQPAVEQVVEFVLQAAEALAEAHSYGIVHRDLKPSNLFVVHRRDGSLSVKVLDFGISKMEGPTNVELTQTSAIVGSPLYMSPEQLRSSRTADARADIWSVGVVLYELLSGAPPYVAESLTDLVFKIATTDALPDLGVQRPDLPPGLNAVIAKCLEKDREKRFQNMGELARAIAPFGPERSTLSVQRISGILRAAGIAPNTLGAELPVPEAPAARTPASWGRTSSPSRSKAVFGAATLLALLIAVALWFGMRRETPEPSPTTHGVVATHTPGAPAVLTETPSAAATPADVPNVSSASAASSIEAPSAPNARARAVAPARRSKTSASPAAPVPSNPPSKPEIRSLIDERQ